jgi:hypothetical protein
VIQREDMNHAGAYKVPVSTVWQVANGFTSYIGKCSRATTRKRWLSVYSGQGHFALAGHNFRVNPLTNPNGHD